MRRKLALFALLGLIAGGCAHTIRVDTPPPASRTPATRLAGPPLAMETVDVRVDGDRLHPSDELLLLVANQLRKSALFLAVYEPAVSHEAPPEALRLDLTVDQTDRPEHPVSGTLKALFVLGTAHLLAPLLPLEYGYEARLEATLVREGGFEQRYESRADGSVDIVITFGNPRQAGIDLRAAVLSRALELLVHELSNDPALAALAEGDD